MRRSGDKGTGAQTDTKARALARHNWDRKPCNGQVKPARSQPEDPEREFYEAVKHTCCPRHPTGRANPGEDVEWGDFFEEYQVLCGSCPRDRRRRLSVLEELFGEGYVSVCQVLECRRVQEDHRSSPAQVAEVQGDQKMTLSVEDKKSQIQNQGEDQVQGHGDRQLTKTKRRRLQRKVQSKE